MKLVSFILSAKARKQLTKAPVEVKEATRKWMEAVERFGLRLVRVTGGKGLHDEPLKGKLKHMRTIRLSRSWRLYYREMDSEEVTIVKIERIDRHEY